MIIRSITGAIRSALKIQTKEEKALQRSLQESANKLLKEESHDLFVKNIDGKIQHLTVTDSEIAEINKSYAERSRRVGIPNLDDQLG